MRKFHECNYCEHEQTIPDTYVVDYLDKLVDRYNTKKSEKALTLIEILVKTCWKAEIVLSEYYPHINQIMLNRPYPYLLSASSDPDMKKQFSNFCRTEMTVKSSLIKRFYEMYPSTKSFGLTKCFHCDKYTCEFHETHGGFEHYKCNKCCKYVSICGWCAEYSICFQMIRTQLCQDCQHLVNKQKKAKSEEVIINLFHLEDMTNECKTYVALDKLEDDYDDF